VADRGDVFRLQRRLGFGAARDAEAVVIVQATPLNSALPTTLAVPLDPAIDVYGQHPAALRISAGEVGTAEDHVALLTELRAVRADRLAPGRIGRLRPRTLATLNRLLRLILDL
jgi:mRNA-degrading endonuclease toxin of MazEF toxin-antitoxin module